MRNVPMIVTIDGPAGSGKSSAAKELARRLGYEFLDTGAMYRAVAFASVRDRVELAEGPELEIWLAALPLDAEPGRLRLDGVEIEPELRTPEISSLASKVAAIPAVRRFLVSLQRRAAEGRDIVTEGRDQGTVVFPDADCKFFLTADPLERARRRQRELAAVGRSVELERVAGDLDERDRRDAARDCGPMRPADDAVVVDGTTMTAAQVVDHLEREIRRCERLSALSSTRSPTGSSPSS